MKNSVMLTITSLSCSSFLTFHLRATSCMGLSREGSRTSLWWCRSPSSGCTQRWCLPNGGSGYIIMFLLFALFVGRALHPHEGKGVGVTSRLRR